MVGGKGRVVDFVGEAIGLVKPAEVLGLSMGCFPEARSASIFRVRSIRSCKYSDMGGKARMSARSREKWALCCLEELGGREDRERSWGGCACVWLLLLVLLVRVRVELALMLSLEAGRKPERGRMGRPWDRVSMEEAMVGGLVDKRRRRWGDHTTRYRRRQPGDEPTISSPCFSNVLVPKLSAVAKVTVVSG